MADVISKQKRQTLWLDESSLCELVPDGTMLPESPSWWVWQSPTTQPEEREIFTPAPLLII